MELTTRPITQQEERFYSTMLDHYEEQLQSPHITPFKKKFIRQTVSVYTMILETKTIWTYETSEA
jgi:hypothetical protein